jgi:UPF0176 protein
LLGRVLIANEGIYDAKFYSNAILSKNIFYILFYLIGINGTLAGEKIKIAEYISYMHADKKFINIDWKRTQLIPLDCNYNLPFLDLYIRSAKEIVSSGGFEFQLSNETFGGIKGGGIHLKPETFHSALKSDTEKIILDIRNEFEYDIGHFSEALSMNTHNYSETKSSLDSIIASKSKSYIDSFISVQIFLDYLNFYSIGNFVLDVKNDTEIYMYCTGGIRCEKASAYLCSKGYNKVFQVKSFKSVNSLFHIYQFYRYLFNRT